LLLVNGAQPCTVNGAQPCTVPTSAAAGRVFTHPSCRRGPTTNATEERGDREQYIANTPHRGSSSADFVADVL
jgi:hypothetical protein